MRINYIKQVVRTSVRGAAVLLAGVSIASTQQQINLTAGPSNAILPDGSSVPMWGYECGAAISGSTAVCAALNAGAGANWSPVIITVPTGQGLTINLTNQLPAPVPTSLVIAGQLGGGLGDKTQRTTTPSPLHDNQGTTWPIANSGAVFTPPAQQPRVQSFSTEVPTGGVKSLTWTSLNPGTYLIESGTHPSIQGPMGLYGMLVVTCAPGSANCSSPGTAYPNVTYVAEVPLLMSEIDPAQNRAINAAVGTAGFNEGATNGPYTAGAVASINLTSSGSGYTSAPTVNFTGGGGSGATAQAIIDTTAGSPTFHQVVEIDIVNGGNYTSAPKITISGGGGTGATATAALGLNPNGLSDCSGGAAACYPPVVNYTPLYYLFNGVAFDKTNATVSLFATNPNSAATGNVMVRLVNAGLRMHVPTIVGSQTGTAVAPAVPPGGFTLIAEDGNPVPGTEPRVQSEVFMAAGKTFDVMINVPAPGGTALPVFDRQLSLSGNSTTRDAGMLAYIGINGALLPGAGALGAAQATPDTYNSVVAGKTLTVSDPSLGVIANDVNVYGVKVVGTAPAGLTLNENGTFIYTAGVPASFTYCGNGATSGAACATVTLAAAPIEAGSNIKLGNDAYTSNLSRTLSIKAPGILANDNDSAGYPLKVVTSTITAQSGLTVVADQYGGFDASIATPCTGAPCTYTFTYSAQNSQGTQSASTATVSITFGPKNGPAIQLVDGATKKVLTPMDYRWVVEEDRTFYVDPAKTTNTGPGGSTSAATFGTNFHTSYMPLIAQGCTGQGSVSCGAGQTVRGQDPPMQTPADPSELHLDTTKRYYISVLPGDGANPFNSGNGSACLPDTDPNYDASSCGHGMGGTSLLWNGSAWVTKTLDGLISR